MRYLSGFFFQAEDGIRDLVRSRGLGDVYKRQIPAHGTLTFGIESKPELPRQPTCAINGVAVSMPPLSLIHI